MATSSPSYQHAFSHVNYDVNYPFGYKSRIPTFAQTNPGNSHATIPDWTSFSSLPLSPDTSISGLHNYEPALLCSTLQCLCFPHHRSVPWCLCALPTQGTQCAWLHHVRRQQRSRHGSREARARQEDASRHHNNEHCPCQHLPWGHVIPSAHFLSTAAPLQA